MQLHCPRLDEWQRSPRALRPLSEDTFACEHAENERLRILLVDDENSTLDILSVALKSAGYSLYPASSGEDALRKYQSARPELILLDLFLPDMDGKDLLRRLRNWTSAPILVMSARNEEAEIIACLDAGADDYLTKPVALGELLARIRAALRRAFGGPQSEAFTAGDLRVDFDRREVFVGQRPDQTDRYRISSSERSGSSRRTGEDALSTHSRGMGQHTIPGRRTPFARHGK